eukprot:1997147-Amphidinium_carterae.1
MAATTMAMECPWEELEVPLTCWDLPCSVSRFFDNPKGDGGASSVTRFSSASSVMPDGGWWLLR